MLRYLLLLILFMPTIAPAQVADSTSKKAGSKTVVIKDKDGKKHVYTYVDKMPKPGYDIHKYLFSHMKVPKDVPKGNFKIQMRFIIRQDGSIDSVSAMNKVHPAFDKELVRVVRTMPSWQPGMYDNQPVDVHYILPLTFKF